MKHKGYLLDMDGVIYRENHLLPGASDLIKYFLSHGIPFVFLTNNSSPTPHDLVVKLKHLGVAGLSPRHFYTAAQNTADFLAETNPRCTAFVLGEAGLTSALAGAGIPNDSISPDYVIVGEGSPSTERIALAHQLVEKGAWLVCTNPDYWCPIKQEISRPGAGALAAYLEASTGRRAYYLGKPNPYMFFRARRLLHRQTHEVVMVGDTMETDIRGAVEIGMQACLVLSGSTKEVDLRDYVYQPTFVLSGVDELLEEITGRRRASQGVKAGAKSPCPDSRSAPGRKRHHDQQSPRLRPRPAMTR